MISPFFCTKLGSKEIKLNSLQNQLQTSVLEAQIKYKRSFCKCLWVSLIQNPKLYFPHTSGYTKHFFILLKRQYWNALGIAEGNFEAKKL